MKLKKLFIYLFIINTIVLSLVVVIINNYHHAIKELEDAYKMQHKSVILADELRQSSDDLTRVARTYVITGNKMFEKQFHTILNIRNGTQPRPKNYNRIYWDFLTLNESVPTLDGEIIPLRELMKQAGFREKELALLYQSQKESDKLTYLETKAMNAMKGIFQDQDGNYTTKTKPNLKLAADIMHSKEYHKAKISIMKPLDEFYKAFEIRTYEKVQKAHEKVKLVEKYVSFAILFLIALVLISFFIIISRIIYPLEILKNTMLRLAKNDMEVEVPEMFNNDEVGEMIGTVDIFKNNAIRLIESEQKNQLLLDLAGEGIFGLDDKGRFTFLNPMACKLLGYENQDCLIGKYIFHTIIFDNTNKTAKREQKLMLCLEQNITFKKQNGEQFPIDYVSTPIKNKNNFIDGSVVVFSDITHRKKHENQLKKAMDDSKSANRSKSVFLANMSHELRTPLNAILGFTYLLKNSPNINEKEKENLETIQNSGEHLLTIINEILDLSKIEAGKIDITARDFYLYDCIHDIEQMFTSRYENKGLAFNVNIKTDVPKYIKCDEKRLRQILINLLGNALKFTIQGSVSLNIIMKKSQLHFEVVDSGIGIEEKDLELIFKPFEQIDKNKYTTNSTGLGLSITKKLINKMGGDIFIQSKINRGSKFYFSIDYETSKQESIKADTFPKEVIGIKNSKQDFTIMVVDDIKENRLLLVQMLNNYGFKTIQAKNSKEAIGMFNQHQIDLIFMDILMPEVNGLETTRTIRELKDGKHIPIIIVSAHVFKEDEQQALNVGANAFLSKPIKHNEVIQNLEKHLNLEFIYKTNNSSENTFFQEINISDEVLKKIQTATETLDIKEIETIIESIDIDSKLYDQFKEHIKNFNFKELSHLCSSILSKKS